MLCGVIIHIVKSCIVMVYINAFYCFIPLPLFIISIWLCMLLDRARWDWLGIPVGDRHKVHLGSPNPSLGCFSCRKQIAKVFFMSNRAAVLSPRLIIQVTQAIKCLQITYVNVSLMQTCRSTCSWFLCITYATDECCRPGSLYIWKLCHCTRSSWSLFEPSGSFWRNFLFFCWSNQLHTPVYCSP